MRRALVPLAVLALLVGGSGLTFTVSRTLEPRVEQRAETTTATTMANFPLHFVPNAGQSHPRVDAYVQGADTSLYFTDRGATIALSNEGAGWAVRQSFVGGHAVPEERGATGAVVSYFKGDRTEWVTGVPTYSSIAYRDVWPGIDAVYSGNSSRMKYRFVVHPGADPSAIRMAYRGADVSLGTDGLRVATPVRDFIDEAPVAYQGTGSTRRDVAARFSLEGNRYGFDLGRFDRSRPLIIDPAALVYAGFIGGAGSDSGTGIDIDDAGNAYVVGSTSSSEASFPVVGTLDPTYNTNTDAFIAKVSAAGTGPLVYAGYIGGGANDDAEGVAVDSSGNAYVTGETSSTEASFPVVGTLDPTYNTNADAFIAEVNPTGMALTYAGYIGGSGNDGGKAVAVDGLGNAYVAGETDSTEASFPELIGPDLTYNLGTDAFVAKVNATGSALTYAGYVGGNDGEQIYGIALDGSRNAYITGQTLSDEATFPETVGPDLTYNTNDDAYIAKVNAAGSALVYAGFIGGTGSDNGRSIAVDDAGNAYVGGQTNSDETEGFPLAVGPDLTAGGGEDAFVTKVNAAGTGLVYSGYIGGSSTDYAQGIGLDEARNAYVTGQTSSTEASFPVIGGPDLDYNGGIDAFVSKVSASGAALGYSGYIGGAALDTGNGIAVDASGNAYVTGYTNSDQTTFPETVGPDLIYNTNRDAFVAKIAPDRPDAKVKGATDAAFLGDGVYNTTAAGQTRQLRVRPGKTGVFEIRVDNEGPTADSFLLDGSGSSGKFIVSYFEDATNITAMVVAGTYTTDPVAPATFATITAKIKVKSTAKQNSTKTAFVLATSETDGTAQDKVGAKVKVKG